MLANIKKNIKDIILFGIVFIVFFNWIWKLSGLVDSGDPADIWKTITSFYSQDIYPSYVLYKGFMAVYPYVWFYQLSLLLHVSEFLFIKLYHALLFSYVSTIGVPHLIAHIVGKKASVWQRILMPIIFFWLWQTSGSLQRLTVDLPSCAIFILACNSAVYLGKVEKYKKVICAFWTGMLCMLCASISGQYSIAALCVGIYAVIKIVPKKIVKDAKILPGICICLICLLFGATVVHLEAKQFRHNVVEPMKIGDGHFWLTRGMLYMMDMNRILPRPTIINERGNAILESYYGSVERAKEAQAMSGTLGYGWEIEDYLRVVIRYPIDFVVIWIDRVFLCLSVDFYRLSFRALFVSYTLLYLTLYTAVKWMKHVKNIFQANFWLVAGSAASIIPCLVLSVEMRYALSFQAMVWGIAVLGPALPWFLKSISGGIVECWRAKSLRCLGEKELPWGFVLWIVFVGVCFAHMGSLYAQTDLGTGMLFHWK